MKSFILPVPKTPSKIDYYYFCYCGREFVSNNVNAACKCGNSRFYDYDDVRNYNINLLEIEKIKNGYIAFFEYPVFRGKVEIERKIIFKYENLKFEDLASKSKKKDELIAEFVKLVMIEENKWEKYHYIWEKLNYKNLGLIQNGGDAMDSFANLHLIEDENLKKQIKEDLLKYCKLDTFAMVKLLEKLEEFSQNPPQ